MNKADRIVEQLRAVQNKRGSIKKEIEKRQKGANELEISIKNIRDFINFHLKELDHMESKLKDLKENIKSLQDTDNELQEQVLNLTSEYEKAKKEDKDKKELQEKEDAKKDFSKEEDLLDELLDNKDFVNFLLSEILFKMIKDSREL